jgi:hypothetical protein
MTLMGNHSGVFHVDGILYGPVCGASGLVAMLG